MPDTVTTWTLKAVWIGMFSGVVSGAVIGLFFHRPDWMGGYGSFRRRLTRLGHISFFGLAFVNLAFVITHDILTITAPWAHWAGVSLIVGAITMPACCFLTAWRKSFRRFFFIPVGSVLCGIFFILIGWPSLTS